MKLVLDNNAMIHEFFEDSRLIGIMVPVQDYQFCWLLNKILGIDLRINAENEIKLIKKSREYFFSIFEYIEPDGFLTHFIYDNKNDGEYLLPEFKHLDYLWLMKGDRIRDDEVQEKIHAVKNIQTVQLVAELTNEKIKNKGHLIF